jgi:hypothetical protein
MAGDELLAPLISKLEDHPLTTVRKYPPNFSPVRVLTRLGVR